jgi:endonuclease YncB( thermonuclease family)
VKWLVSSIVIGALLSPLASVASEDLSGKVIGITDGDTLTVLVERKPVKIRLAEIDTPERGQPWATRAKQALSEKVFGKSVRVEVTDTDRYGRSIGHIFLGERDINREMIREGHAWAYRKYLRDPSLLRDEEHARENQLGLWSHSEVPIAPWDWRAGRRVDRDAEAATQPLTTEYDCGAKRYCRDMTSCGEATFYLETCGLSRLDGDGDGIPCEAICR